MNQYAVFDWDNTVRKGFTLFDWVEYLIEQRMIGDSIKPMIDNLSYKYSINEISHDEYARLACKLYVKEVSGHKFSELQQVAQQYSNRDIDQIWSGMESVFEILFQNRIDIIIISGAPKIVIDFYKTRFHIKALYAFKEEVSNGVLNGRVAYNYGYDKLRVINKLKLKYGTAPLFGFGDSFSDLPLLDEAVYGFSINSSIGSATRIDIVNDSIRSSHLDEMLYQIIHKAPECRFLTSAEFRL